MTTHKTLDDLMKDYEPERLAELAKNETPEAIARSQVKRAEEIQREIRQGLRDQNGDWIEQLSEEDIDMDDDEMEWF